MTARIRYELRVGTLVSRATAATFQIPVGWTVVPRSTVYHFRVPADRDLTHLLHRLTEHDVRVLEIRRCPEPPRRARTAAPLPQEEQPQETAAPEGDGDGVVVPFTAHRRAPIRR